MTLSGFVSREQQTKGSDENHEYHEYHENHGDPRWFKFFTKRSKDDNDY